MKEYKQPSFFYDQKGGIGKEKEIFIDYFLSWALRCAPDNTVNKKNIDRKVQEYSKNILIYILSRYPSYNDVTIENTVILLVETEKQWEQIDLFCVVHFVYNDIIHKCLMVFENKMYSPLKDHQLPDYKSKVKQHHKEKFMDYEIIQYFITVQAKIDTRTQKLCKDNSFTPITFDKISGNLQDCNEHGTGNALFDEFWYNYI